MDYIAVIAGITGAVINSKDVRLSTTIWLLSNLSFIVWATYTNTYSILILNVVYLIINSRTLIVRWHKP